MQNVQKSHEDTSDLAQKHSSAPQPSASASVSSLPESALAPKTKSASLEAVHAVPESRPKLKSRSRFSTAIRKLSGSTRKKETHPVEERSQETTVISSGGEEAELATATTSASPTATEEKLKKKGRLSKRFLLSSLSKKSKISPKTSIDADDDNEERNAAALDGFLDVDQTKKRAEEEQLSSTKGVKSKLAGSTITTDAKATKQSKVQITISGKKAAVEGAKTDLKSKATTTQNISAKGFSSSSIEADAKAKKKLKSKKISTTTTTTATTAATVSTAKATPKETADKLVITHSTSDTPPSERAPLKPTRSGSVSSTQAGNETPTLVRKPFTRTATTTHTTPSLAQRIIGSATKAKKQRANTLAIGEAELMQDPPISSLQRGHRLPRPTATTTPQTSTATVSPTTAVALAQLQLQPTSATQSKSHASQSLADNLQPPTYPPPPVPPISPAVTPELRSPAHITSRQQLVSASKLVTTPSSSGPDDYLSSAETEAAAGQQPDSEDRPISQDLSDEAAEAALQRAGRSLRKHGTVESQASNLSSSPESPFRYSGRRKIPYVSEPISYDYVCRWQRNDDISFPTEATEHSYDTDNEYGENQLPAFGDLTMEEEIEPTVLTSTNADKREHLYKILVIGELGTGKTSFIKRYVHQFFSQNYRATIGVDFALKVLHWDDNTIVRLQLWDIAGQERFGNMTRVYYKEAVGAFIVFDVTRSATFDCVSKWKEDLDSKVQLPDGRPIPCILLANKCDQEKQGIVTQPEKIDEYVKENGFVGWFETSARDNINIDEAARALVNQILLNDKLITASDLADNERFNLEKSGDPNDAESKSKCSC